MSEFRIGTAISEPAAGTLKVGSTNVQEIYLGANKIWPTSEPLPPGQVQIGNLIWTDVNTSTLDTSGGGAITIVTNNSEAIAAYNTSTPAAAYWEFDPVNSVRGLYYNKHAVALITPPTGFRLPTQNDYNNLRDEVVFPFSNIYTSIGGGATNFWNSTIQSDSRFGTSGFNAIAAGWMFLGTTRANWMSGSSTWWDSTRLPQERTPLYREQATFISGNSTDSTPKKYTTIRFCKDA